MTKAPALYNGADSASPGQPLPAGTKILAAYVGAPDLPGQPDALHVWSIDEWNLYLDPGSKLYGGPELRPCPIYLHDYRGNAAEDAANAIDAVMDLGWTDQKLRIIADDLETLVDPVYVSQLNQEYRMRGFRMMKYGSSGFVNQNPPTDGGTWMALLTNRKPTTLPAGIAVGQQWHFGQPWDLNVFSQFVYDNCGRGPRKVRF